MSSDSSFLSGEESDCSEDDNSDIGKPHSEDDSSEQ